MTPQDELVDFLKGLYAEALDIVELKNTDYATDDDPLSNFRLVESLGIVETEKAIFVRLSDKYARLANFLKRGDFAVKDERVEDTVKDLINYAGILLYAIKKRKKDEEDEGELFDYNVG
ncbi:MAG: hypothetical protein H0Z19_10330 [Archaeoglobus sp.]|uniref:hypothetical protein n=1 Tax=Archaeoglobus sp. TaxID=1872626 RepID=UPI001D5948A0|nr:hypothetical protein [Archaeoglobus sp.]MBO8180850.1 hypothetical protein [Archaeoglobus sp.]